MTFACDHAGFRAAANHPVSGYLGRGNVMSDCQSSTYVRALSQTECNGHTFAPGVLRDFDLDFFNGTIPHDVCVAVLRETEDREAILYRFFHWRRGVRIEHGWLITDREGQSRHTFVTGPTRKSRDVIENVAAYISANP